MGDAVETKDACPLCGLNVAEAWALGGIVSSVVMSHPGGAEVFAEVMARASVRVCESCVAMVDALHASKSKREELVARATSMLGGG